MELDELKEGEMPEADLQKELKIENNNYTFLQEMNGYFEENSTERQVTKIVINPSQNLTVNKTYHMKNIWILLIIHPIF